MDGKGCAIAGVLAVFVVLVMGAAAVFYMRVSYDKAAEDQRQVEAERALIGAKSAESSEIARLQKRVAELEKELAEARAPKEQPAAGAGAKGKKGEKGLGLGLARSKCYGRTDRRLQDSPAVHTR